jgi:hypothetical protein
MRRVLIRFVGTGSLIGSMDIHRCGRPGEDPPVRPDKFSPGIPSTESKIDAHRPEATSANRGHGGYYDRLTGIHVPYGHHFCSFCFDSWGELLHNEIIQPNWVGLSPYCLHPEFPIAVIGRIWATINRIPCLLHSSKMVPTASSLSLKVAPGTRRKANARVAARGYARAS